MDIIVFTWYKIGRLVGCGVKHLQFSYFLRIALTSILTLFYIICCIDLFIGLYFTPHSYFVGSSIIQHYKLTSHPCNPSGIIISIMLLFYLASCLLILWCVRALVCYNLSIWYKWGAKIGFIKMDTYNIWWNLGFSLLERYIGRGVQ